MPEYIKVCPECDREFVAKNKSRIYCYPVYGEKDCGSVNGNRNTYKKRVRQLQYNHET